MRHIRFYPNDIMNCLAILNKILFPIYIIGILSIPTQASDYCSPKDEIIKDINPEKINKCLDSISQNLDYKIPIDKEFTKKLINRLLPINESGWIGLDKFEPVTPINSPDVDLDYQQIVGIINLLHSDNMIKRYIDFRIFSWGSADERIDNGLGELFVPQPTKILKILSSYSVIDQNKVIESLAFGLCNIYHPHINKTNYRKTIYGPNKEILDEKYPYREQVKKIDEEILHSLDYSEKHEN